MQPRAHKHSSQIVSCIQRCKACCINGGGNSQEHCDGACGDERGIGGEGLHDGILGGWLSRGHGEKGVVPSHSCGANGEGEGRGTSVCAACLSRGSSAPLTPLPALSIVYFLCPWYQLRQCVPLQMQDKMARHVAVLEKKAVLKFKTAMTDKNNTIEVTPIVLNSHFKLCISILIAQCSFL